MAVASVVLIIEALEKIIAYAQDPSSPAPIMDPVTISIACLTIGELLIKSKVGYQTSRQNSIMEVRQDAPAG